MERTSRITLAAATVVILVTSAACAPVLYSSDGRTRTYMGFSVGVTNAPPPPRLQYVRAPRYDTVEFGVSVVEVPEDCDLFYYGSSYYLFSSGYWYVSDRYDGTYRSIDVQRVPRAVLEVPENHWRHHPRGHAYGNRNHGNHGNHGDEDDDRDQH